MWNNLKPQSGKYVFYKFVIVKRSDPDLPCDSTLRIETIFQMTFSTITFSAMCRSERRLFDVDYGQFILNKNTDIDLRPHARVLVTCGEAA